MPSSTQGENPLPGASASAEFELLAGANPYFTNIDPLQNNAFYLSQDLRIFTVSPGIDRAPVPGALPMASDDFAGELLHPEPHRLSQ
jgi:hypothetical protein